MKVTHLDDEHLLRLSSEEVALLVDLCHAAAFSDELAAAAEAVARAIQGGKHLIVEAGTGVGKSFAYLVPAILEGLGRQIQLHGLASITDAVGTGLPWR